MSERTEERRRALLRVVSTPPAPSSTSASATMRGNRRRDTHAELAVRRALHAAGLRFRVDFPIKPAAGRSIRPDIVFTRTHVAVFVDGCFWHCCPDHGRRPRINRDYWSAKLQLNRDRDERQTLALTEVGWRVLRFWEHEDVDVVVRAVRSALTV